MSKSGLVSKCEEEAISKHEVCLTLSELISCSTKLLKFGGRFYVVYDAKTNKPIKGNGKLAGVKNYYVSINTSESNPTEKTTDEILSMSVFGQLDNNVSYNENDLIKKLTIGSKTIYKTVGNLTKTE